MDDPRCLFEEPDPVPLRRGPKPSRDISRTAHRGKILSATVHETAERGLVETSVGDIAARAKVSRRTFYEHFDSKERAFFVAYDLAAEMLRRTVSEAVEAAPTWSDRLLAGVRSYVEVLTRSSVVTRMLVVEVRRAGTAGEERERQLQDCWVTMMQAEIARARREHVGLAGLSRDLTEDLSVAVVGGLGGLVRGWLDHGDDERLMSASLVLLLSVLSEQVHALVALLQSGATAEQLAEALALPRPEPTPAQDL